MNAQLTHHAIHNAAPLTHGFASSHVSAHKLVSFAAAILFTAVGVGAMFTPPKVAPVSEINGTPVINLAPVQVRPNADELRAAALLADADISAAAILVSRNAETDAGLLGAQLAMPYYSFGNKFGRMSSKE